VEYQAPQEMGLSRLGSLKLVIELSKPVQDMRIGVLLCSPVNVKVCGGPIIHPRSPNKDIASPESNKPQDYRLKNVLLRYQI
jgi:hypothetical protein